MFVCLCVLVSVVCMLARTRDKGGSLFLWLPLNWKKSAHVEYQIYRRMFFGAVGWQPKHERIGAVRSCDTCKKLLGHLGAAASAAADAAVVVAVIVHVVAVACAFNKNQI